MAFAALDTRGYPYYYCKAECELAQVWGRSLQPLGSMALNVLEAGAEGPSQLEGRVAAVVARRTDVSHRLFELVSAMDTSVAGEMPSLN